MEFSMATDEIELEDEALSHASGGRAVERTESGKAPTPNPPSAPTPPTVNPLPPSSQ